MPDNNTAPLIRYDKPGTLVKPGPIGRLVRLFMAFLCLSVTLELVLYSSISDLQNPSWWFLVAIGLLLVTYVVNIGLGLSIGTWPRHISIVLIACAAIASYVLDGDILGEPLWLVVTFWMGYLYAHLGVSFLIASLIATPGCEMRAIPHLLGLTTGRDVAEHYCPAFIDRIDRWEQAKLETSTDELALSSNDPRAHDIMRNGRQLLLYYGIPFAVLQLAGNFGGFVVATLGSATALIAMSLACFVNIRRSKRVHCYFLGPWLLVAGVTIGLYGLRLIDFGPGTWSLIINTALIGGVCIAFHTEMLWGKYFSNER